MKFGNLSKEEQDRARLTGYVDLFSERDTPSEAYDFCMAVIEGLTDPEEKVHVLTAFHVLFNTMVVNTAPAMVIKEKLEGPDQEEALRLLLVLRHWTPDQNRRFALYLLGENRQNRQGAEVVIKWNPEDVKTLRPEWSIDKCTDWLEANRKHIQDRCIELGWEVIEALLPADKDDGRYPEVWTTEDGRLALKQGWNVIAVDTVKEGEASALLAIQRYDEADIFQSDKEAGLFVANQALAGDVLAKKALRMIK